MSYIYDVNKEDKVWILLRKMSCVEILNAKMTYFIFFVNHYFDK